MVAGLTAALDAAEQDASLRAVVLTGSGDAVFVSGADLKFLRDAAPERRALNDSRMLALMDRLEALPVPVIAALNGAVIGGGSEIALCLRPEHRGAPRDHHDEACGDGSLAGWGGLARLAGLVGRSMAGKLLFTALAHRTGRGAARGPGGRVGRPRGSRRSARWSSREPSPRTRRAPWRRSSACCGSPIASGPEQSREVEREVFLAARIERRPQGSAGGFLRATGAEFKVRGEG